MKLFGQHVPPAILFLAVAEFGFTACAFMFSGWVLVSGSLDSGTPLLRWSAIFGAAVLVGLTAMGLYQVKQRLRIEGVLARLTLGLGIAAVCVALIDFIFPLGLTGSVWLVSFAAALPLLGLSRYTFLRFADTDAFRRKILIYGAGERAASLLTLRRRSDQRGFRIAAFVPSSGDKYRLQDSRVIEPKSGLLEFARANDVNEIVVAMDDRRRGFPTNELLDCKFSGIAVLDLLAFLERETGKVKADLLNPGWLIFSETFAKPSKQISSRALDVSVAAVLLLLALPLMMVIAAAILLEDGAPILYRQQRVGFRGKHFTLYKFRSMIRNAESDGRPLWAGDRDPRVTRVGRVIRKLRLDELPQLLNVIRGNMSLVGPRPERPEFVDHLARSIPYYHERHSVKPGITGWAQLCYPYGSSEKDALEKLHYDLYYVKNKSLIFDLVVLLQTVEVVFWGKGAR